MSNRSPISTWLIKAKPTALTLSQFCELHALDIEVFRRPDEDVEGLGLHRYYASFVRLVQTVDDAMLTCPCGNGRSTRAALADLARQVSGKEVVISETSGTTRFHAAVIKGL